jgi:uncharacterized protein YrrD
MVMRIQLGDEVRTRDGKDAGKIDKLIFDPASHDVKAAVVRKGFFLPDDVEIPLERLQVEREGVVRLDCSAEQVDDLPRFYEASYTTTPPVDYTSTYDFPVGGVLWPVGGIGTYPIVGDPRLGNPMPPPVPGPSTADRDRADAHYRQDIENAIIDEGSEVRSREGEKVGEIHSVAFDSASGRPTSFVVRKGFLFNEDLELPAETIASVDNGVVHLSLDKEQVAARFPRATL